MPTKDNIVYAKIQNGCAVDKLVLKIARNIPLDGKLSQIGSNLKSIKLFQTVLIQVMSVFECCLPRVKMILHEVNL